MDGYQYEQECARYLKTHGFRQVSQTPQSGDQGVDVIAYRRGLRYGIQCKYYSSSVGNKAVQEAYAGAAYYDCDVAVVMTNSDFTPAARKLADQIGVMLWENQDPEPKRGPLTGVLHMVGVLGMILALLAMWAMFPDDTHAAGVLPLHLDSQLHSAGLFPAGIAVQAEWVLLLLLLAGSFCLTFAGKRTLLWKIAGILLMAFLIGLNIVSGLAGNALSALNAENLIFIIILLVLAVQLFAMRGFRNGAAVTGPEGVSAGAADAEQESESNVQEKGGQMNDEI